MKHKIDFYVLSLTPTATYPTVAAGFDAIRTGTVGKVVDERGGYTRELHGLGLRPNGSSFGAILRKFRTEDLPSICTVGGEPTDITLNDDEGIIEQNHFVFYKQNNLVGWQINGHGSHPNRLAIFLSKLWHTRVEITPVIQPDAVRRLMEGEVELKKISVSIPRPTNPDLYRNDDFGHTILTAMSEAGADSLHLEMGVDLRRSPDSRLAQPLKKTMQLLRSLVATTAKAQVIEDGYQHTIDLVADRVSSYQEPESEGRLPAESMYQLIENASDECSEAIREYFGTVEQALR